MSARECVLCQSYAEDRHHLTGRDLDPDMFLWHCHDHHELVNDDWNTADVPAKGRYRDAKAPGSVGGERLTTVDVLYVRLRRLSLWFSRVVEAKVFLPVSRVLATALAQWADELEAFIAALDTGLPQWRDAPWATAGRYRQGRGK